MKMILQTQIIIVGVEDITQMKQQDLKKNHLTVQTVKVNIMKHMIKQLVFQKLVLQTLVD